MLQIYRGTVRGRFDAQADAVREALVASAAEHDGLQAAFVHDGTFTYDEQLTFFTFRYELRANGDTAEECELDARFQAESDALAYLQHFGIAHRDLKVSVWDMASVWQED
jgi:hypothetical protein